MKVLILLFCLLLSSAVKATEVQVVVSGKFFKAFDSYRVENAYYLASDQAAQIFGGQVYWSSVAGRVQLSIRGRQIRFTVDSADVNADGQAVKLSRPVVTRAGFALIPIEFFLTRDFADLAGVDCRFNATTAVFTVDKRVTAGPLRYYSNKDYTRIVLYLKKTLQYYITKHGRYGLDVTVPFGIIDAPEKTRLEDGTVNSIQLQQVVKAARLTIRLEKSGGAWDAKIGENPHKLVLDIFPDAAAMRAVRVEPIESIPAPEKPAPKAATPREAEQTLPAAPRAYQAATSFSLPAGTARLPSRMYSRAAPVELPKPSSSVVSGTKPVKEAQKESQLAGAPVVAPPVSISEAAAVQAGPKPAAPVPAHALSPAAAAPPSPPAALVKHRIVVDAGHGGKDSGAIGRHRTYEKDINLLAAKELAALLREEGVFDVKLTRDDDTFIPLDERSQAANDFNADLFISLHCNASPHKSENGYEIYFLSERATDPEAQRVADAENAALRLEGKPKDEEVAPILRDMARTEFINDASKLAGVITKNISKRVDLANRAGNRWSKQAAFYVLRGTHSPAILVEMGFITNNRDESKLQSKRFRRKLIEGIYSGILDFSKLEGWAVKR